MDGFAFLFRIPNSATRNRVINQRLWKIEGQTLFVAKWEPGLVPTKPELTSAPIWLELRDVPFQFFNEDGLDQIASLVGEPRMLHHDTATKTNIEVAKVLTVIDPRVPLPEAVNVQFESGTICRIRVSSPWMPPVCSHFREVGHTLRRCTMAPINCAGCGSIAHEEGACLRRKRGEKKNDHQLKSQMSYTPKVNQSKDFEAINAGKEPSIPKPPPTSLS